MGVWGRGEGEGGMHGHVSHGHPSVHAMPARHAKGEQFVEQVGEEIICVIICYCMQYALCEIGI